MSIRIGKAFLGFLIETDGSVSVWSLPWLTVLAIMAGLSIDSTNGYRHKTMMQSAADASAHAGLMDLPAAGEAAAAAYRYLRRNYEPPDVDLEDITFIQVGYWDAQERIFSLERDEPEPVVSVSGEVLPETDPNVTDPIEPFAGEIDGAAGEAAVYSEKAQPKNAVRVRLDRRISLHTGLATDLLRLIDFSAWDIAVEAIAHRAVHPCLQDGMIARGRIEIDPGNAIRAALCLHADVALMFPDDTVVEEGVQISAPDMTALASTDVEAIPGMVEALRLRELAPAMVHEAEWLAERLLAQDPTLVPDWVDPAQPVSVLSNFLLISNDGDDNFSGGGSEGGELLASLDAATGELIGLRLPRDRIYYAPCPDRLTIDGYLTRVVLVTACAVEVRPDAVLEDVVIISTAERSDASATVNLDVRVRLGKDDQCLHGGGVVIVANASIQSAAETVLNGAMMVAKGDIRLSPAVAGLKGVALHALDDIRLNGEDIFGPCREAVPFLFSPPSYTFSIVL